MGRSGERVMRVGAASVMLMACALNSEGLGDGSATQSGGDATDDGVTSTAETGGTMSTADGSGGGDSEGDGPGPMAEEEELSRTDFDGCEQPLWCYSGGIANPAGGAIWAQECFRADMDPPFELTEIEAVIRGMSDELFNVEVQVYDRGSDGPMGPEPIVRRVIPIENLNIGVNTIALDPPVELDRQRFCIGLAAPDEGLYGALGVSVNPGSDRPGVSYLRVEGNGGCWIPQWTDVIAQDPNPSGNWCISGTIRALE